MPAGFFKSRQCSGRQAAILAKSLPMQPAHGTDAAIALSTAFKHLLSMLRCTKVAVRRMARRGQDHDQPQAHCPRSATSSTLFGSAIAVSRAVEARSARRAPAIFASSASTRVHVRPDRLAARSSAATISDESQIGRPPASRESPSPRSACPASRHKAGASRRHRAPAMRRPPCAVQASSVQLT